MKTVHIIRPQTPLSSDKAAAILALTQQIWPPAPDAPPPDIDQTRERWQAQESAHFVIENENSVLAHAHFSAPNHHRAWLAAD